MILFVIELMEMRPDDSDHSNYLVRDGQFHLVMIRLQSILLRMQLHNVSGRLMCVCACVCKLIHWQNEQKFAVLETCS